MSSSKNEFDDIAEDASIDGYEPEFVDVDGTCTRYYDVGSGEPFVLIHGNNPSGSSSANTWSKTFEYLSEEFRLLAFDRIGCGMTDNPDSPDPYTFRHDIDHAISFVETMGLDSCHLAGWSRGGGLATRIAVERPDLFDTLIICNSATLGPSVGDHGHRSDLIFEQDKLGLEKTDPGWIKYFYEHFSHNTDYITDERCRIDAYMETREKARETARLLEEEGHIDDYQESVETERHKAHQLIKSGVLNMPTLYMFGRNDPTVPSEMAMSAFDMIGQKNSKMRMYTLNHCGHMIFLERPKEFSRIVSTYINLWHS